MAILWADGFDHYGTGSTGRDNMLRGAWASVSSGAVEPVSTTPRTGGASLQTTSPSTTNPAIATRAFLAAQSSVGVAFGIYWPTLPSTGNVTGWALRNSGGSNIVTFTVNTDGSINIYQGGAISGVLLETTAPVLTATSWDHVEFLVEISDTVGYIELRVNGVPVSVLTELNLGTTLATVFALGKIRNVEAAGANTRWDDVIAWNTSGDRNNTFLGPARVFAAWPDGDLSPLEWDIVGAATGWEAIDEVPPDDDTTYIQADEPEYQASFSISELPEDVDQVIAVYVPVLAKQSEAGATSLEVSMISDGEEAIGSAIALTTQYTYRGTVFDLNPNGGVPWTKSTIEAATIQVTRVV